MNDASEKPFEATPARIAKARSDGDVARSSELAANAAFGAAVVATIGISPWLAACAQLAIARAARGQPSLDSAGAALACAMVVPLVAALAAVACTLVQAGGLVVAPVNAKYERLDPSQGFKRLCSRETGGRMLRAAAAFTLAVAAITPPLRQTVAQLARAGNLQAIVVASGRAVERIALWAGAVGVAFSLAEYATARRAWLRRLRMSFEERKRELREHDGDPLARGRRRSLHRELLRGRLEDVRDATFVVTNPTHLAIALAYRPPEIAVPRVTVRAAGELALRVRSLARRHRVPIVENVALARALFAQADVGRAIPPAQYVAVAEIVVSLARRLN